MSANIVLFQGSDAGNTEGLWETDGTASGTFLLTKGTFVYGFAPVPQVSLDLTVFNDQVLFIGRDSHTTQTTYSLWSTDGTAAGTTVLTSIIGANPKGLFTSSISAWSPFPDLTVFNNEVLFNGWNAAGAHGLWATNGTAAGTAEITGITGASSTGVNPSDITVFNNKALFNGVDTAGQLGLWTTDGTGAGTTELAVAGAATTGLDPTDMTVFGSEVLFNGVDSSGLSGLWVTDGTAGGTHELTGISGADPTHGLNPTDITVFGSEVLFSGLDASGLYGLWVTEGTAGGTHELVSGTGGSKDPLGLNPSDFTVFDGEVLFRGLDQNGRAQLWLTNGTVAGTQMLAVAGTIANQGLQPSDLVVYDGQVLFSGLAAHVSGTTTTAFQGLWTTDGTAAGTHEVAPIANARSLGLFPVDLTAIGGTVPEPPTISGTVSGQTTTSEAPVRPFAHVTVGDANVGANDTLTITLAGAGGTLNGTGLSAGVGGVYTLSGTAAAITSALAALVFTPKAGAPNTSSMTTFTLSDQSNAGGGPVIDTITTVIDSDPAVAPTISGTVSGQTTTSEAPVRPFAHVTVGDANVGANDTLTITLAGAGGTLNGTGLSAGVGGVYTLSGTAAAITSALAALVFTPKAGAPNTSSMTTFTLSDQSNAGGGPVIDTITTVIDSDPAVAPTISGTVSGQTTTSEAPVRPFAHVTVGDANVGANDTLTITLAGAGGTLNGTGLSAGVGGVYTLSGTAAAITSALAALVFTPKAGAPNTNSTTTFTLSDQSSAGGGPTVDNTTSVIDSDPAALGNHLLLQNTNGQAAIWGLTGTNVSGGGTVNPNPGPSWKAVGTGDFNGDGLSDILWQDASGQATIWDMNGTTLIGGGSVSPNPGPSWKAVGTGDFNGDGRSDILWQNSNGQAAVWDMNGNTVIGGGSVTPNPGAGWKAVGSGDFNDDGRSDILWQNSNGQVAIWEMNGNTLIGGGSVTPNPGPAWQAIGAGDFNHDGHSDILFQNASSGQVTIWDMNGTNLIGGGAVSSVPGPSWHAIGTGGEGSSDILFQNASSGQTTVWEMNGTSIAGGGNVSLNAGPSWRAVGLT